MTLNSVPALDIRFDIVKVKSGDYGTECWKVFWSAVDIKKLGGAQLFEGDTYATLTGGENVYCIAVQSISNAVFGEIRAAIEQSMEFRNVAALPKFVEGDSILGEPLPDAGRIDSAGNLVGNAYNSRVALGAVRNKK